jgi:hypothetical protein
MKKIILFFSFLSITLLGFSQPPPPPTTCPIIAFAYDASGNRIQRSLVMVNCSQQHRTADTSSNKHEASAFLVKAFPNPAQDKINVEITQDSAAAESAVLLLDLTGKTVYSGVTSSLQMQIDVSRLVEGIYLLKITRGKQSTTYNVFKN